MGYMVGRETDTSLWCLVARHQQRNASMQVLLEDYSVSGMLLLQSNQMHTSYCNAFCLCDRSESNCHAQQASVSHGSTVLVMPLTHHCMQQQTRVCTTKIHTAVVMQV